MCLRYPAQTMLSFSPPQIRVGLSFLKKEQPKYDPLSLPSTHLLVLFAKFMQFCDFLSLLAMPSAHIPAPASVREGTRPALGWT